MTSVPSIEELEMGQEAGSDPNPLVSIPTPCRGESSKAAAARARVKTFVFVPSTSFSLKQGESSTTTPAVAKKRGRPRGSKVKQAAINRGKGKQKVTANDIDNNIDADTNNLASSIVTKYSTNNNTIDDPAVNNTAIPVSDNAISEPAVINAEDCPPTASQTDLYSVLGPGRVDWFYTDGCLFGYDPDYLGKPLAGDSRDRPPGENETQVIAEDEQEVQEERLLEEERLLARERNINGSIPEDDKEEKEYHDGPKPFDEANYSLHFFYEHYFAQYPRDSTTSDTDSDCSDSSEDEDDEEEDATAETTHTHTSAKRKAYECNRLSAKKSRLDQRKRLGPRCLEDAEDAEELQQHQGQDQLASQTALMQRPEETYEKYLQRIKWDREFESMKATFLSKAKESNPNKTKLTKKELETIRLKHKEKVALYESSDLRTQQHARGTRAAYSQFHRHWRRWCKRKGYRIEGTKKVDFRVEYEKFFLWLKEGTALEGYDGGGSRKMAVLPFFATNSVQVSEINVNGRGRALSRRVRVLPSRSTLLQHINGVNDLRMSQGISGVLKEGGGPINPIRGAAVDVITNAYRMRIAGDPRMESKKYATINHADGKELDKLRDVMKAAWTDRYQKREDSKHGRNLPHKLTSLRSRLIVSWKHFFMMRGENIRMAKLPHITFHHFGNLTGAITGPRPSTFAIVLIMTQGKPLQYGGCTYGVAVRNSDVEICPIGALAFYLFHLWQTHEEGKPDLHDTNWQDIYLIHGNGKKKQHQQLSPNAHLDGMARLFKATGIVTNQPTHFCRRSGANHAHDAGASLSAIQIHGGWQPNGGSRPDTHNLHLLPKGVAYAMAGALQPSLPPWIKRDCVTPSVELQRQIFPFIEEDYFTECPDWLLWTRNIMEGKSELDGRASPMPMPDESNRAGVLRLRFLLLLVHLRKVILQDAVALLELKPKDEILYGHHHVFNLPVFKSPEFLAYKDQLVAKMITLAPPQSDSLRQNAPYLEAEFRLLNSTMAEGFRAIKEQLDQEAKKSISEFKELLQSNVNSITNTVKTVSFVQTASIKNSFETAQDIHGQAMLYALQAAPSLYLQRIRELRQLNGTVIPTDVSAPRQSQLTPLFQQQSNQAPPSPEYFMGGMEDNGVETVDLEDSLTEQLDAPEMSEEFVQVTLDDTPQIPAQVELTPPSRPTLSLEERLDLLATEVAESRGIVKFDVSNGFTYEMVPRSRPIEEHWEEWFYGLIRDGVQQPSIYWLNGRNRRHTFASSHMANTFWRYVDPAKDKNTYNALWTFKKAIVRGILKMMLDHEGDIIYRERMALAEVADLIQRNTMSLNKFSKMNKKM